MKGNLNCSLTSAAHARLYPKAHRWEFEVREVAAFAVDSSTAQIFEGIADLYLQLANDWKAELCDVGAIDDFLGVKGA